MTRNTKAKKEVSTRTQYTSEPLTKSKRPRRARLNPLESHTQKVKFPSCPAIIDVHCHSPNQSAVCIHHPSSDSQPSSPLITALQTFSSCDIRLLSFSCSVFLVRKKMKEGLLSLIFLGLWLGPLQKIVSFFLGTQKIVIFEKKKEEVIFFLMYKKNKKGNYFFALRRANPAHQVGAIAALRSLKTSILSVRERPKPVG